jgi:FKBP-type peptidyl-prolyl cis-trans isomerase 2
VWCRQGGLVEDKVVELQNSQWAKVVKVSQSEVVLDANPMLAGLQRRLTIEVLGIERPDPPV